MTNRDETAPAGTGGCSTGKIAYLSRKQARANARRHHGARSRGLRAYLCPHCRAWHLGHLAADVRTGALDKNDWIRAITSRETH